MKKMKSGGMGKPKKGPVASGPKKGVVVRGKGGPRDTIKPKGPSGY